MATKKSSTFRMSSSNGDSLASTAGATTAGTTATSQTTSSQIQQQQGSQLISANLRIAVGLGSTGPNYFNNYVGHGCNALIGESIQRNGGRFRFNAGIYINPSAVLYGGAKSASNIVSAAQIQGMTIGFELSAPRPAAGGSVVNGVVQGIPSQNANDYAFVENMRVEPVIFNVLNQVPNFAVISGDIVAKNLATSQPVKLTVAPKVHFNADSAAGFPAYDLIFRDSISNLPAASQAYGGIGISWLQMGPFFGQALIGSDGSTAAGVFNTMPWPNVPAGQTPAVADSTRCAVVLN